MNALERLGAWLATDGDYRGWAGERHLIRLFSPTGNVVAATHPGILSESAKRQRNVVAAGTDDSPAAITDTLAAALDLWAALYSAVEA